MQVIDIQHQYRVVNIGRFIERYDIPCEGVRSRVSGKIYIVIKDYVNAPTMDSFNITFAQTNYRLLPNGEVTYYAEFAAVPLVILPAPLAVVLPFMKDTDIGIHVDDFITEPSGRLEINMNFAVVPSPFNIYIRPVLTVQSVEPLVQNGVRVEGTRKDIAYAQDVDDFAQDKTPSSGGTAGSSGVGQTLNLDAIPAAVKIQDVKE